MSDAPIESATIVQPGTPSASNPQTVPAPAAAPAPAEVPLESMSPDQLDALAARLEAQRANRPPSVQQQLDAIRQQLTATSEQRDTKITERQDAKTAIPELEQQINTLTETLRRAELVEATTAAGFREPSMVAEFLMGRDGDVATLVTEAAGSGVFAMRQPATSAQVGGPGSTTPDDLPDGYKALIAEINAATGRG